MDIDPYAPPEAILETDELAKAEAIRRQYLSHETHTKGIGTFFYLIMLLLLLPFFVSLLVALGYGPVSYRGSSTIVLIFFVMTGLGILGYGLHNLRPWAKKPAILISVISLFAIPIGTLIGVYGLYFLLTAKAKTVFSAEYRAVIDATPHIKYQTPMAGWILLFLLIILLGSVIITI